MANFVIYVCLLFITIGKSGIRIIMQEFIILSPSHRCLFLDPGFRPLGMVKSNSPQFFISRLDLLGFVFLQGGQNNELLFSAF